MPITRARAIAVQQVTAHDRVLAVDCGNSSSCQLAGPKWTVAQSSTVAGVLVGAGGGACSCQASPAAAALWDAHCERADGTDRVQRQLLDDHNFANNGAAKIEDPDIALYVMARNAGACAQPLAPEAVTVTARASRWTSEHGCRQSVGVKFYPDLHSNLAPGWNATTSDRSGGDAARSR